MRVAAQLLHRRGEPEWRGLKGFGSGDRQSQQHRLGESGYDINTNYSSLAGTSLFVDSGFVSDSLSLPFGNLVAFVDSRAQFQLRRGRG
jgi:hypothetical protein